MPNLKSFFLPQRLFDSNPGTQCKFYVHLIVIFTAMIALAIIIRFFAIRFTKGNPVRIKLLRKIYYCFLVCGTAGYFLLFFRYENVRFLACRFLLLFLFLVFIVWLGFILIYLWRKYPKEFKEYQDFICRAKYMPKPKKKK
jgi:hypothetical protein